VPARPVTGEVLLPVRNLGLAPRRTTDSLSFSARCKPTKVWKRRNSARLKLLLHMEIIAKRHYVNVKLLSNWEGRSQKNKLKPGYVGRASLAADRSRKKTKSAAERIAALVDCAPRCLFRYFSGAPGQRRPRYRRTQNASQTRWGGTISSAL